jgi:hypothetical protein
LRDGFLDHSVCRIAITGIKHVGGRGTQLLIVVGNFECGSLVNRRRERAILFAEVGPSANSFGFRAVYVFHGIRVSFADCRGKRQKPGI